MYTARQVSSYIIKKCVNDREPISNLQLQKILYFIQRDYLRSDIGNPAFNDDFEAWRFGPVIPEVYYDYSGFGSMAIDMWDNEPDIMLTDKVLIDPVIEEKRNLDPWDLVEQTHKNGGAWALTYQNGNGYKKVIEKELIRTRG